MRPFSGRVNFLFATKKLAPQLKMMILISGGQNELQMV